MCITVNLKIGLYLIPMFLRAYMVSYNKLLWLTYCSMLVDIIIVRNTCLTANENNYITCIKCNGRFN